MSEHSHSVFVTGYYGAGNFGDEAILYALLETLRSRDNSQEIIVESLNPQETETTHNVSAVPRLEQAPGKVIQSILGADELVIGGGTMINPRDDLRLATLSTLAGLSRTRIQWFCVGVQPPNNPANERLYRGLANVTNNMTVRDAKSKQELSRIGVTDGIEVVPDPVFDTDPVPLTEPSMDDSYVAVVIRDYPPTPLDTDALATALDQVASETGLEIRFIPYQDRDTDHDQIQAVRNCMTVNSTVYDGDFSVAEIHGQTAGAELVVGMRLHSIIVAAGHQKPFVTLSYKPKCRRVATQIGDDQPFKCNQFDPDKLAKTVENRIKHDQSHLENATDLIKRAGDVPGFEESEDSAIAESLMLAALCAGSVATRLKPKISPQ